MQGLVVLLHKAKPELEKETSHSLVDFYAETIEGNLGMEGNLEDGSRVQDQFCKSIL